MIGIIAAMDEEVVEIVKLLEDKKEIKDELGNENYILGKLSGKEVVVKKSGVGKVNAAISTTLLIDRFKPEYIVNIGSAGSLKNDVKIGDIVVATSIAYWDVDVFGWSRNFKDDHPSMVAHSDSKLVNVAKTLSNSNIHIGPIVSGDSFVTKGAITDTILEYYPEAICAEMEAAAIAFTARRLKTPVIVIRGISDQTLVKGNEMTFEEYLKTASVVSANLCKEFIGKK